MEDHPKALDAEKEYGSKDAKLDENLLASWKARLEGLLEVRSSDGVTLKEEVEFRSPLSAPLWDAWRAASRDPEQFIGQWAREGVPLGMDMPVPDSGIFPSVDPQKPWRQGWT